MLSATASSNHVGYEPGNAIDGNCATLWHTEWSPLATPPHHLTMALAQPYTLDGLSYQPRQDGNTNGIATQYQIDVSDDGATGRRLPVGPGR